VTPLAPLLVGIASVIDGDTLEIHGQRIRIWGVDAPESRQVCELDEEPWRCGTAAANALDEWIAGRTVSCEQVDTDRYKRVVAKCSIGADSLNEWLVREGWALDYTQYSKGAFAPAQEDAATRGVGIWAGQFQKPWEWRKRSR
jgi:endonuclease YncB( thermonuclease family)